MIHRVLASMAVCLALIACGTAGNGRQDQPDTRVGACQPGSNRQREAIDGLAQAVAQQEPTAEQRARLIALANATANVPEGANEQDRIFCRFQSARAANLATRTVQTDDEALIGLVAGGAGEVARECRDNPGEPSGLHCRQLGFFGALGASRSLGRPMILASRGAADAVSVDAIENGLVNFAANASETWGPALTGLTTQGAEAAERQGAWRELVLLACHVHDAGARMEGASFGLTQPDRRRIGLATRRADAGSAQGLGLELTAEATALCAADAQSMSCQLERQGALIRLCRVGGE